MNTRNRRRKRIALIAAIPALCLAALLLLVFGGGRLMLLLGLEPFYIDTGEGRPRLVQLTPEPASLPPLEPGAAAVPEPSTRPTIIDTDMAPDDWLAILYLLRRPDVDVKAITVVGTGEAHCRAGVRNARGLLALAGRPDIPVACGREAPLAGDHAFPADWREAVDSLLGLSLPSNSTAPYGGSAVELMADVVEESAQEVHLLALGPLTNVAEAMEADPGWAGRLQGITIMGGALNVPGNVGLASGSDGGVAEWNIYVDPHAAALVLGSGARLTLVPLDASRGVPVTYSFYRQLKRRRATPAAEFVYRVLTQQQARIGRGDYYFWDPFAAAILTDEALSTFEDMALEVVEEQGPDVGRIRPAGTGAPVHVATGADRAAFETLFLDTINR